MVGKSLPCAQYSRFGAGRVYVENTLPDEEKNPVLWKKEDYFSQSPQSHRVSAGMPGTVCMLRRS
jgi:hypothetical protein